MVSHTRLASFYSTSWYGTRGGEVLPYITYTGMCPQRGRDFKAPDLERGIHFRGGF